jgi:hypothetical protein
MRAASFWTALRIAMIYAIAGTCWIIFSDRLFPNWQTTKGLVYITATALLFLLLI